ncbi:HNH endonuclease [Diaminobutyricimonas sp. LJ205]|uniref:HNH endonuclease n=1 Tax=Diaminobutyricimonas sp. LJ205 TaxID=2683590 RepID=UPI003519E981
MHSDLDHTIAKEHGGPNTAANLAHLCRKHHRLKHLTGWSVEQLDHGILRWTSPTGHQYTSEPELRSDPARWETLVSHSETVWSTPDSDTDGEARSETTNEARDSGENEAADMTGRRPSPGSEPGTDPPPF